MPYPPLMSTKKAADERPGVVIAKTEASQHARRDKVSLMETDDYVCLEPLGSFPPFSGLVDYVAQSRCGAQALAPSAAPSLSYLVRKLNQLFTPV